MALPSMRSLNQQTFVSADSTTEFMAKVYRWMTAGLALTGLIAFTVAQDVVLVQSIARFMMPIFIGQLALVFGFSFLQSRVSPAVAGAMFLAYAASVGLTFSMLFMVYTQTSIASAFLVSAGTFFGMSVYGTVTKRDLTSWSAFLFMGLFGVVIAGLVNMFLHSGALSFVLSCCSVVVFTGLTAYDTQKLRQMHASGMHGNEGTLAISGALSLYLDFINLFLSILRLFGRER